jgi:hypothetical protein
MANSIVTKFMIGTEQGRDTIAFIGAATTREKYRGKVAEDQLETFIRNKFDNDVLHAEMNNLSNQYIVVYADGVPAGYARVTSKGIRPQIFAKRTLVRIADFRVLDKFNELKIKKSLFDKCVSVCNAQQVIWISECRDNTDLGFFESYGFKKNEEIDEPHELGLNATYMVKDKTLN